MGVMRCVREGCKNIMCDRYSFTYGHICNECFDELCDSNLSIKEFLETGKKVIENRYNEIDKEFPNRLQ